MQDLGVIMRMPTVKRWGIVDTPRPQTLGEHLTGVVLIAFWGLWQLNPRNEQPPLYFDQSDIAFYAMTHDWTEIDTGDLPSSLKTRVPDNYRGKDHGTPEEIYLGWDRIKDEKPWIPELVKWADHMEMMRYLRQFYHTERIKDVYRDRQERLTKFLGEVEYLSMEQLVELSAEAIRS